MRRITASLMTMAMVAGCASGPAGVSGYDAFIAETVPITLDGTRSTREAAQCFEDRGSFLPLSEFSRDGATGALTYRLRVSGLWFEQVRITPHGPGSKAEARVASNLNDRWRQSFERDRMDVLRRCMGH